MHIKMQKIFSYFFGSGICQWGADVKFRVLGRGACILLGIVFFGFVSAEIFARAVLGLGDPPLTLRDPEIEYMFKPGTYQRFGNSVVYNEYSMRSLPPPRVDVVGERVLVVGDSVVNGGVEIDQMDLASELLRRSLTSGSWVGNVSAGSWGPANMAAYMQRFGTFGADHILVVLSSHDLHDVPTFPADLGPDFPQKRPTFALEEALMRYLPRYLPLLLSRVDEPIQKVSEVEAKGESDVEGLIALLKTSGAPFEVFLHPSISELTLGPNQDGKNLRHLLETLNVNYIEMRPYLSRSDYRDEIHMNAVGHKKYAQRFLKIIHIKHKKSEYKSSKN